MLKEALPFIKEIKVINYDPEEQVSFKSQFILNKMLKSTNRISTIFVGNCIFSNTKIPAHGTINDTLLLNCEVINPLSKYSAPIVSIRRCRVVDGKGEYQKISSSVVENSDVKLLGKSDGTTYKNCVITGDKQSVTFQSCNFINCILTNCTLVLCDYDDNTKIGDDVKEIDKKKKNDGFFNLKEPKSFWK